MFKFRSFVVISLLLLMLVPVTSAFAEEGQQNIVDTAVSAGQFQTLVAAVTEAELAETLSGEGPFTVFAPTDDAFTALLNTLGVTANELLAREDLSDILLYHVVQGNIKSTDLKDGAEVETLNGKKVIISLQPSAMVNDSGIVTTDIEASNGYIHVIDAVLLPPTDENVVPNPKTGSSSVDLYVWMSLLSALGIGALFVTRSKRGMTNK